MIWYDCNVTREYRFLVVQDRPRPLVTTLRNDLRNAVGVTISTQPVRNHLRQSGLKSRRACIRIPLTRLHQKARLTGLTITSTGLIPTGILYSSPLSQGTVFTLQIDILKCGEDVGERFQDANIFQYDHYSECSIMVWAGISRGGRTDLHIVMTDMMTGNRTPVHRHGGQRSTSSSQGGWGLPPAGDHRPYGLARTLTWSQLDRARLEHATGGDFATSGTTTTSHGTGKCAHWRVEQAWDGSHPVIHWKHETPLPGCDCGSHTSYWQLLLLVIGTFSWHFWEGLLLWWHNVLHIMSSKKQTLPKKFKFGIQKINISPNTCHF